MRSLKLLVAGALLFGLALVVTAQASDEDVASPAESAAEPIATSDPTPDESAVSGSEASDPSMSDAIAETSEVADGAGDAETVAGVEAANDGVVVLATPEPLGDSPPAAPVPVSDDLGTADAGSSEKAAAVLGEIGYDDEGRPGRIHLVVRGDTLWDISDAYLGTPWVWPSIWTDNRNIENPHLINPGDHIWITDSEMRLLSPAEAEAMLAGGPPELEDLPAAQSEPMLVELDSGEAMGGELVTAEQQIRRVSLREWVGLISAEDLEAAASIVQTVEDHVMIGQFDRVYIGLGEGDVEVGDQFEIIRKQDKVEDPETGRFLGYYVAALGWIEVTEVHEQSSLAAIRLSTEDIRGGDRLIPRRPETRDIAVQPSPEDIEGMIAFFPRKRVVIGPLDFVYLNRGTLDGLETGSPLEVVRGGGRVDEPVHGSAVEIPNRVVAQLLVVDSQPETSVALVARSETDLLVGDSFRGATR